MGTQDRPRPIGVRRPLLALLLGWLVVLTAACGGDDRARSAGDAPSPSASSPVDDPTPDAGPPEAVISAGWLVAPGRLGPLRVGTDAASLTALGLVVPSDDASCDTVWRATPELSATATMLDFRAGGVDDLDQVSVFRGSTHADSWVTAEGAGIGTTLDDLRTTYAGRLHGGSWPVESGTLVGHTLFGADGALTFEVDDDEVIGLHMTAGPTPATFVPPVLGCRVP